MANYLKDENLGRFCNLLRRDIESDALAYLHREATARDNMTVDRAWKNVDAIEDVLEGLRERLRLTINRRRGAMLIKSLRNEITAREAEMAVAMKRVRDAQADANLLKSIRSITTFSGARGRSR